MKKKPACCTTDKKGKSKTVKWFPKIDYKKCKNCRSCFHFCAKGVYDIDLEKNKVIVAHPEKCVFGCTACDKICPAHAISHPKPPKTTENTNSKCSGWTCSCQQ
jgi:NAD-dependent dihydropyrimidine dehydrogenase PreA subunit